MRKLRLLWKFFYTFVKIGGFTLGGGYAMIPIIQREAVDVHKWVSEEEIADIITLGQSMPGVIGVNTATALGAKVAGIPGAISATLGMVTPSIVVIAVIASVFDEFQRLTFVQDAFLGVRAAVAALMVSAVIRMMKTSVRSVFQAVLFGGALAAILVFGIKPQYTLIASALAAMAYGPVYRAVTERRARRAGR